MAGITVAAPTARPNVRGNLDICLLSRCPWQFSRNDVDYRASSVDFLGQFENSLAHVGVEQFSGSTGASHTGPALICGR